MPFVILRALDRGYPLPSCLERHRRGVLQYNSTVVRLVEHLPQELAEGVHELLSSVLVLLTKRWEADCPIGGGLGMRETPARCSSISCLALLTLHSCSSCSPFESVEEDVAAAPECIQQYPVFPSIGRAWHLQSISLISISLYLKYYEGGKRLATPGANEKRTMGSRKTLLGALTSNCIKACKRSYWFSESSKMFTLLFQRVFRGHRSLFWQASLGRLARKLPQARGRSRLASDALPLSAVEKVLHSWFLLDIRGIFDPVQVQWLCKAVAPRCVSGRVVGLTAACMVGQCFINPLVGERCHYDPIALRPHLTRSVCR